MRTHLANQEALTDFSTTTVVWRQPTGLSRLTLRAASSRP
jgi:hypothetical protein